jgi:hypothetical protein
VSCSFSIRKKKIIQRDEDRSIKIRCKASTKVKIRRIWWGPKEAGIAGLSTTG